MTLYSVTQVLQPFADFSGIRPEVLEAAADRGTRVHSACLAKAAGAWSKPLPESEVGYYESFCAWMNNVESVSIVHPVFVFLS